MIDHYYQKLEAYLQRVFGMPQLAGVVVGAVAALLTTVVFLVIYKVVSRVLMSFGERVVAWTIGRGPLRFQQQQLFSAEDLGKIVAGIVRGVRGLVLALVAFFYLNVVLSFFGATRAIVSNVLKYVLEVLSSLGGTIVAYLPNLFVILVILLIVKYLLRLTNLVFHGLQTGRITVAGFYPEWAKPTFNILRLVVVAFTLVIIFPYLPGSGSPAFQGVSLFLGLLLSLGSTAAISNVVAGIVITYTRAFKVGDRVRIASAEGKVTEKTLFVTRLRTVKNMDISIPNSMVLSNHILNFSAQSEKSGMILHTKITVGYDVAWRKVHELLIDAAKKTEGVEPEPEPFVLQKSLDDFSVAYELNAYSRAPDKGAATTSRLHQNIQDNFHEAGIEIMSPHFAAVRDGGAAAIPDEHLPTDYEPPPFRVHPFEGILSGTKR